MAAKQDAGGCGLLNLEFERNRGMGFPKKKLRALMGGGCRAPSVTVFRQAL